MHRRTHRSESSVAMTPNMQDWHGHGLTKVHVNNKHNSIDEGSGKRFRQTPLTLIISPSTISATARRCDIVQMQGTRK